MAEWSSFHTRIMPRAPGCPVPVIDAELRNAAAEFLQRTRAWREWLDPLTVFSDSMRSFDVDLPLGAMVVRIEAATRNGTPLPIDGAFDVPGDPMRQAVGDGVSTQDRQTIVFSRLVPAGTVIQLQASLAPSETATGVPDHIAAQYRDPIVDGALYRIRSLTGYPFSDDAKAAGDLTKFEREVARVAALVFRSNSNTVPRARVKWC